MGRVTRRLQPMGVTTSYSYDDALGEVTVTDPRSVATKTAMDLLGRPAPTPDGLRTTTYVYDARDLLRTELSVVGFAELMS